MFTEGFSFPHPVLGLDDDISGSFSTTIQLKRTKSRMIVFHDIQHEISNDYIKSLIHDEHADILIKLYCSSTFKTWTLTNPGSSFEIDENDLCNKVEIQVFVATRKSISSYSHTTFNSHYSNYTFSLEGKEVIAVSGKIILPIEKVDEKLGLGNIFRFMAHENEEAPICFQYLQNKIHIIYPKAKNGSHPPNLLFKTAPWTAYNLFILPALSGAFQFIKDGDREDVESYEWFTVISNLFPEDKWEDDPYVNAQLLLRKQLPILNVLSELVKD